MNASSWPRLLATLTVALVVPLASCGEINLGQPDCVSEDPDTLVLIAQSVKTADLVPCIATMPPGWEFEQLEVDQEGTRMVLDSDRGGDGALVVTYDETCRTKGAKRIPSDEAGAQRFERVRTVSPAYSGVRYYDFGGGCVRYDFEFETDRVSGLLNEASLMLGFTTREDLRLRVSAQTDGKITDAP